jgi:hypothetical protein
MSTLRVSKVETAAVDEDLVLTTGNTSGPTLSISSANDNIYFNGTPVFETSSFAPIEAYDQANTALSTAQAAFSTANNAASTGKAIAMAIVFG